MGNKESKREQGPAINMAFPEDRPSGRYITAKDLAERLLGELHANEVLLWPPDLFAYTSYIMQTTAAYQLVVSPPSQKTWPPTVTALQEWICEAKTADNFVAWLREARRDWLFDQEFDSALIERSTDDVRNAIESFKQKPMEWAELVQEIGAEWPQLLNKLTPYDFKVIDDNVDKFEVKEKWSAEEKIKHKRDRHKRLLEFTLKNTPPLLLAIWGFFYDEVMTKNEFGSALRISDLLCNQDHIQSNSKYCDQLWRASQALLTMHAIADIASLQFGLVARTDKKPAEIFAEELLTGRLKERPGNIKTGGSLATLHTERCRVLPKRHNPSVGITLRSISSNLAFHQSAVDIVWRKTADNNILNKRFIAEYTTPDGKTAVRDDPRQLSILLLPFPLTIKTKDFREDTAVAKTVTSEGSRFFSFEPHSAAGLDPTVARKKEITDAAALIREANNELPEGFDVDLIVYPEAALSVEQFKWLEEELDKQFKAKAPSMIIAGVRETKEDLTIRTGKTADQINFSRTAVYCKYMDLDKRSAEDGECYRPEGDSEGIPKYIQYKHHRWRLDDSQITRYGLSAVLPSDKTWWESIKIPKRRVSFIDVGDMMTISHLICEDLARQDPISDLVRHVGPTLVVTILLDGPQLKNRWSARYATVLADDPGCSVITLTSIGMVKRHSSGFGSMSRVIALWNESGGGHSREIELEQGAQAVLLTLTTVPDHEKTADGRKEKVPTTHLRLVDVIQVYPTTGSQR